MKKVKILVSSIGDADHRMACETQINSLLSIGWQIFNTHQESLIVGGQKVITLTVILHNSNASA
jgi:hypothetical protein